VWGTVKYSSMWFTWPNNTKHVRFFDVHSLSSQPPCDVVFCPHPRLWSPLRVI
jgi:hypothetical protein